MLLEIRDAQLYAIGTVSDSITFTSNSITPSIGDYEGIKVVLNINQYSVFDYCNFYYASKAIFPHSSIEVRNSSFKYNDCGIWGISWPTIIDSCIFINNIYAIKDGGYGNHITNSIFNDNQYGIYSVENTTIENCIIESNSIIGIKVDQIDTIRYSEIRNNEIGLQVRDNEETAIYKNIIENNRIGIEFIDFEFFGSIYCNKICNNTNFNMVNSIIYPVYNVSNNNWCTSDSSMIAITIFDGYDDISYGLVHFMPIDTTNCYLTTEIYNSNINNKYPKSYPNPTTGIISIENSEYRIQNVSIFDIYGKEVMKPEYGSPQCKVDLSKQPKGIYIIKVTTSKGVAVEKVILE